MMHSYAWNKEGKTGFLLLLKNWHIFCGYKSGSIKNG